MCPYDENIPQPTDTPAASQPQLLANFQAINTLVNVNHVEFDDPDQGKHKWVSMPDQAVAPATAAAEVAIFGFTSPETGATELYFRKPSSGDQIPMTESGGTTTGWSMLPSGLLIKWGSATVNGPGNVDANASGKAFTTLYKVMLSNASDTVASDTYVAGGTIVGTTFNVACMQRTVANNAVAVTFNWLVIGV
jgi:hypothetical protein